MKTITAINDAKVKKISIADLAKSGSGRSKPPRPRKPTKYSLEEGFSFQQSNPKLDTEKALRSVAFLLDYVSDDNQGINQTAAMGLGEIVRCAAANVRRYLSGPPTYRLRDGKYEQIKEGERA